MQRAAALLARENRLGREARGVRCAKSRDLLGWTDRGVDRGVDRKVSRATSRTLHSGLSTDLSIYLSIVLSIYLCELLMPEEVTIRLGRPEQPHLQMSK